MSKQQKRKSQRRHNLPQQPSVVPASVAPREPAAAAPSRDFNPDYTFIIKDLKRIGLLAGTFIAALIVLSFILR